MATFVVCHGAWSGGWSWKKLRRPLAERGHVLWTPTYTGLGERSHLASPAIDLDTHIADVLGVLDYEDLREIILVGHSYGGMVATGVADRAPDRLKQLIYLDAFVPEDGERVLDGHTAEAGDEMQHLVSARGDGWRLPPRPLAPDVDPEDVAWLTPRRGWQPFRTYVQRIKLTGEGADLPRTYIYCSDKAAYDPFKRVAGRVRDRSGWRYLELASGHIPNVTKPTELADLFDRIATGAS